MKFRLILFILISIVPFALKGQLHTDSLSKDVIFYSNANMYVGQNYSDADKPSLYIDGSAKYVDSGTTANKIQITQLGVTQLMGDFVDSIYVESPTTLNKLFSDDSYDATNKKGGVILFAGSNKRQRIYREVPASSSTSKYRGYNYINFPIVRVNQGFTLATADLEKIGHVVVEPTSSISIEDLQVGNGLYQGGFALDARYIPGTKEIQSPFALIKNLNTGSPQTSDGWCRVDLTLADMSKDETFIPNYYPGMDPNDDERKRRFLTGFASPFKELAADYMFYQVLFEPDKKDLTSNRGPILNPKEILKPGKGYFIAQEVSEHDKNQIWDKHTVKREDRFIGEYRFSRKLFKDHYDAKNLKKNYSQYYNTSNIKEYFNTEPVKVSLDQGLNFLGNPFTAPLDLYPLIAPASLAPADNYNDHLYYDAYKAKGFAKYVDPTIATNVNTIYGGLGVDLSNDVGYVSVTKGQKALTNYDLRGKYWIMYDGMIH